MHAAPAAKRITGSGWLDFDDLRAEPGEKRRREWASEKLTEAWQAVSSELYKAAAEQQQAAQGATGDGPQGEPDGDAEAKETQSEGAKEEGPIIDAEVVDEKTN